MFDRLIPAYQIRDDNYEISMFYKRALEPLVQTDKEAFETPAKTIRYLGKAVLCVPATAGESRSAQVFLALLKAIGIILAVFLIAAINALVAH